MIEEFRYIMVGGLCISSACGLPQTVDRAACADNLAADFLQENLFRERLHFSATGELGTTSGGGAK